MKLISLLRALMYALALETTTSSSAPVPANVLWNALPCSSGENRVSATPAAHAHCMHQPPQQAGCSAALGNARQGLHMPHLRGDTRATIHGPDDHSGAGHGLDALAHTVHAIVHQVYLQGRYWQCSGHWQCLGHWQVKADRTHRTQQRSSEEEEVVKPATDMQKQVGAMLGRAPCGFQGVPLPHTKPHCGHVKQARLALQTSRVYGDGGACTAPVLWPRQQLALAPSTKGA